MNLFLRLVISALLIFISYNIKGNNNINSDNLRIRQLIDIPENDVNCIYHDSKGFVWIGTLDGLHKFDGYTYKTYRIDNTKNSISSNMIIAIDEDSKGNIWIGTYGKGICKLNPVSDYFTSFVDTERNDDGNITNDVSSLIVDSNDNIWVGSWFGVTRVKLDSTLNEVKEVESIHFVEEESESDPIIKSIFQDKDDNIWIGTNLYTYKAINPKGKLSQENFDTYRCTAYSFTDFEDGIIVAGEGINSITRNKQGPGYEVKTLSNQTAHYILYHHEAIWLGYRTGITMLNKNANGEWTTSKFLSNNFSEESLSSDIITWITNDDIGQIWAGTRGGGVNIISSIPKRFQHYKRTPDIGSLGDNLTRSMLEDSYGNLWIGTEKGGVSFLKNGASYKNGFKQITTNSTFENRVYAIEEIPTPNSKEQKSLIWLGTSYPINLIAINPHTLKRKELNMVMDDMGFIFALELENDSTIWAGTYNNGLWRLTIDNEANIKRTEHFTPNSKSPIASFIIRSIFKDSSGNLWIGTDKGLNKIEASQSGKQYPEIKTFTLGNDDKHLNHDYILQIIEAKDGTLWIGTMGGGLIKYHENKSTGEYFFNKVTTQDGLPNNSIKSIVEDNDGYLWLASNKGLTKYNPVDGNMINYNKADGLQENEFSEICAVKRKNGELVFGGINGFNTFYSKQFSIDLSEPKMYFNSFFILNQEINAGDLIKNKRILDKSIEYTKNIELNYEHNSFSIGFVGIHYNAPQKHNYRYKLEGFDKEWYKASPDYRLAKYTNVPDGEYTFKVMGSNSDNIWCNQPIELNIKIKPPLYRSSKAFALYIILLCILTYFVYRMAINVSRRKRQLLMANLEKNKVEEISKAKLQFFTNISHEFRTPLSLISAPLDQLIDQGVKMPNDKQRYNLKVIKHNTGLMMRLVNQLLDFRKLDQNKLKLKPSKQNINDFLENIFQAFELLAKQKNIDYHFKPIITETNIWIDVEKMEKVVYNLLSNAFKFTPENGKIVLRADVNVEKSLYTIQVIDTGIGIDNEEAMHVFERYYQTKSKTKQNIGGTGIGLALAKGIVDLHEGKISFANNKDTGTTFSVSLKMGREHFPADIIIETGLNEQILMPEYKLEQEEAKNSNETNPTPRKEQVLIVEDNYELRKQLVDIFKEYYKVLEAEDGAIGLDVCNEKMPDLIISDVMMPNMDGIEMCKQLKNNEATSHIPILLLTAKTTEDTQIDGYEFGADSYLPKPFNIDVLKASVKSLIKNREQLRTRFQKDIEINPEIISNTPADAKFLEKILSKIEENLSDSEYSVEQLAEDYGVSRIYLNRKIKALTGETTNQFVRNIRLKHAAELLKQNKLNISEVTWKVGYNDLRTFRKRFKEKFDMSPSEYAKQFKK